MIPEETKEKTGNIENILAKVKGTLLNFIVPLLSVLSAVLILSLYVYPTYKELPVKKAELDKKTALRDTLSKKVDALSKLIDFKDVFDENLNVVNKVLVPEPEVPRLLDQASQIASRAGMDIDRLSYSYSSKGAEKSSFEKVTVSMSVKSSFEQLVLFMELVEKAARYVSVPNFRYAISASTGDEDFGLLSSSFSLDSPYLFVESSAVTDEPIGIDMTSNDFTEFMSMLKGLDYYDFVNKDIQAEEEKPEGDKPEDKKEKDQEEDQEQSEELENSIPDLDQDTTPSPTPTPPAPVPENTQPLPPEGTQPANEVHESIFPSEEISPAKPKTNPTQ
jgi:Tfp pilus assembly protein PilO